MTALQSIAGWAAREIAIPRDVVTAAARAVFDTLACMLAGLDDPAVVNTTKALADMGAGNATALPDLRLGAPWAAMINGTAAHALDFDDSENVAFTHPSAVLVPALLALGEETRATGAKLVAAYAVGYEVLIRIGQWAGIEHYKIGWHSTSTVAAFGAAAACGHLIGLDAPRMTDALGLAASMAGGFRSQFGYMAKPLHAGLAAKTGVLAAKLAKAGVTGAPDALDGGYSFATLMMRQAPGADFATATVFGHPLALETCAPTIKRFAACGATHGTLEGVLDLQEQYGFAAADIAAIETELPDVSLSALRAAAPTTPMEARFSMAHCVAAAVVRRGLTLKEFDPAAIADPAIKALGARVRALPYPGEGAIKNGKYVVHNRVLLNDGRKLERTVHERKGSPERPLSDAELIDKLDTCAAGAFGLRERDAFAAEALDFARVPDVAAFMDRLARRIHRR